MSKNPDKIMVYGTSDGKLYIKPIEFFNQPKIQELIIKISESEAVKSLRKHGAITKD